MNTNVIDITPSWAVAMDFLIITLESGDSEGRELARQELRNIARQLDAMQEGSYLVLSESKTVKEIREGY
jgi:hypothetical protein